MQRAWEAVKKSGVPESLQPVALKEAVDFLREAEGSPAKGGATGKSGAKKNGGKSVVKVEDEGDAGPPDEGAFFSQLAAESEVDEQDIKDILQVTKNRKVHVTSATKTLGTSRAEQAKTIIALVSSARAIGLGEDPVNAEAVRQEAKRKHAFDTNNFAAKSLTPLKGFNAGATRDEIVLTSKWVTEFKAAVDKAHGRVPAKDEAKSR